jgi:hypothetical protein
MSFFLHAARMVTPPGHFLRESALQAASMAAIFFSAACAVPFVIIAEQRDKAAQQVAHTGPTLRRGWWR